MKTQRYSRWDLVGVAIVTAIVMASSSAVAWTHADDAVQDVKVNAQRDHARDLYRGCLNQQEGRHGLQDLVDSLTQPLLLGGPVAVAYAIQTRTVARFKFPIPDCPKPAILKE